MWTNEPVQAGTTTAIRIRRHGGVAVARAAAVDSGLALIATNPEDPLRKMWSTGVALLRHLGAHGEMHVAIWLTDQARSTEIARWSSVGEPAREELASISREANRALGGAAWEPPI